MNITIRMPETKVPNTETNYMCTMFDLPSDGDFHMIASVPYIVNNYVMHHMLLFGCADTGKLTRLMLFGCVNTGKIPHMVLFVCEHSGKISHILKKGKTTYLLLFWCNSTGEILICCRVKIQVKLIKL